MKHIFIMLAFLSNAFGGVEGDLYRYSIETPESFAQRQVREGEEIIGKAYELHWNGEDAILAFYRSKRNYRYGSPNDSARETILIGRAYLRLSDSSNEFKEFLIDTLGEAGGAPYIVEAGFLNADADPEDELILIASYDQKQFDVTGTLYDVSVYDNITDRTAPKLEYKRNISEIFQPECECKWSDGRREKAKFKSLDDVSRELKRLKFRQFYKNNYE